MTRPNATLFLCLLLPVVALAQPSVVELSGLRSIAQTKGSVEVKVTTRAVAAAEVQKTAPTSGQRIAIGRAQQKIMLILVSRGLVVGNEVSLQPDGSLVLRVLPQGLDFLAQSADVHEIRANADTSKLTR